MVNKNLQNIAKELQKNTTNTYLSHFLNEYIRGFVYDYNDQTAKITAFQLLKFHQCLKYIEKEKFDISGWMLWETPHSDVFCFRNSQTNQTFDLIYDCYDNYEISPSYVLNSANHLAQSIEEAIELYEN